MTSFSMPLFITVSQMGEPCSFQVIMYLTPVKMLKCLVMADFTPESPFLLGTSRTEGVVSGRSYFFPKLRGGSDCFSNRHHSEYSISKDPSCASKFSRGRSFHLASRNGKGVTREHQEHVKGAILPFLIINEANPFVTLTKAKLIKYITLVLIKTLFFLSVCILCGGKRGGGEVQGLRPEGED